MKLCNFRPLCWLALVVILAIGSAMLAPWCAFVVGLILFTVLLWCKLPRQFKVVAMACYLIAIISYVLTTYFVSNPYYRTYDTDSGLRGIILRYVRWYLSLFLSEENADLVYAMLLGDRSVLTFDIKYDFTATGLAHILSVSGLHVSALYAAIATLLRWCRVPRRAHLWVIAPVLIFYGYLCGWQYAIMRAVIMCLVYAVAKHKLRVADSLSVMSLAVVIILIIYPYALVSASFLLSFACVLGTYLWYQTFLRAIPSEPVSMYLAVTLSSFPFLVYFFGSVPVLAIVANVVLVPLLMFAFYLGFFTCVTFVCGAFLWLAEPVLNLVRWVMSGIGKLSWAMLPLNHGLLAVFVFLIATIICSRFVFLKPKIKYTVAGVLFTCYLILLVV